MLIINNNLSKPIARESVAPPPKKRIYMAKGSNKQTSAIRPERSLIECIVYTQLPKQILIRYIVEIRILH